MAILLIKYKTSRSLWAVFRIPRQFEQPRMLTCLRAACLPGTSRSPGRPPPPPSWLDTEQANPAEAKAEPRPASPAPGPAPGLAPAPRHQHSPRLWAAASSFDSEHRARRCLQASLTQRLLWLLHTARTTRAEVQLTWPAHSSKIRKSRHRTLRGTPRVPSRPSAIHLFV